MPKEITWGPDGPFACTDAGEIPAGELEPGRGHRIYDRVAVVRWSKASGGSRGSVELGVAKIDAADHTEVDKHYVRFDRSAINKLIRDLRGARDQAFGRDE